MAEKLSDKEVFERFPLAKAFANAIHEADKNNKAEKDCDHQWSTIEQAGDEFEITYCAKCGLQD
ncbi:hypothetical protein [Bacillus sp. B-jedd]|uniref:hypothetical protein n=1 Tax=Bacillus sp. B-jedd TaxID=1476857 RepID=UPI0005156321|nr:hypothetical protein [Bacillus sp. B-jedd]CEG28101.1 hypothetical protein BN1002_02980 [Bacillus sp. B-jedd]